MTIDFVPMREEILTDYQPGETQEVFLHDGSMLMLHKSDGNGHDVTDHNAAIDAIEEHRQADRVLTGLLYMRSGAPDLHDTLQTVSRPLNALAEQELCPGSKVLDSINAGLR